jgi:hypothetical protein
MMGLLGATMIGLAWVADFVLTPAFLSLMGKPEKSGRSVPAPAQGVAV